MNFFWFPLEHLPVIIVIMLIAFSVHEFAHAWTAWKFGDDTAYREGRVTLNPLSHLDWIGMLFLVIAGFGWAKPVPVRRSRFKKPRQMNIMVTAAGPISNLLLAFLLMFIFYALLNLKVFNNMSPDLFNNLLTFMNYWLNINLALFLFNLLPIPPLDGYRIVEEFLPLKTRMIIQENSQWITFGFLIIVFIPPLRNATIGQLMYLKSPIMDGMQRLLSFLF
ncbi:site-2 protease family protein [Cohnella sp. LGH]|uniref:Zn-dependent protease n=1 Tax=Cohnella phaseoli TaxID=456490 RepID=A0A3D9IR97_9BACL|nr:MULTISPECIES: site-2 protease family protein [Cohnella]QTH46167.1 site-2 protease family protein [Cohnella sp. LGH]RED64272.1 Zn-dependent protease [Cohnella phaseoli]